MYDFKFGQNGHFSKKETNQKNRVFFMPHALCQSGYPFGQCGHFSSFKSFENHDL
jgi:hypothetical protein